MTINRFDFTFAEQVLVELSSSMVFALNLRMPRGIGLIDFYWILPPPSESPTSLTLIPSTTALSIRQLCSLPGFAPICYGLYVRNMVKFK